MLENILSERKVRGLDAGLEKFEAIYKIIDCALPNPLLEGK